MNDKIRSFIAINTSEKIKSEFSRLLNELKVKPELSIKWVKPEQLHLTLVFLGEVSPLFIQRATASLKPVINNFKPFQCQLQGLGAFPDISRARVLWLGLSTGKEELTKLHKEIVRNLIPIGYTPERRPFSPHLTIGRLRDYTSVDFIQKASFSSSIWEVREVIIYQSNLYPEGPVYKPLARLTFSI